jgi:hypothetical protein
LHCPVGVTICDSQRKQPVFYLAFPINQLRFCCAVRLINLSLCNNRLFKNVHTHKNTLSFSFTQKTTCCRDDQTSFFRFPACDATPESRFEISFQAREVLFPVETTYARYPSTYQRREDIEPGQPTFRPVKPGRVFPG